MALSAAPSDVEDILLSVLFLGLSRVVAGIAGVPGRFIGMTGGTNAACPVVVHGESVPADPDVRPASRGVTLRALACPVVCWAVLFMAGLAVCRALMVELTVFPVSTGGMAVRALACRMSRRTVLLMARLAVCGALVVEIAFPAAARIMAVRTLARKMSGWTVLLMA